LLNQICYSLSKYKPKALKSYMYVCKTLIYVCKTVTTYENVMSER